MSAFLATLKLIIFAILCLLVVPIQSIILLFTKSRPAYVIPYYWHAAVSYAFGIKINKIGEPIKSKQTLYVSNHISYLDIPAIGGILPYISFVAKNEVSGWPVFGFLSKLQQTAFIKRSRNAAAKESKNLDSMLNSGKSLYLFAEGTSTDGTEVRPFKSSLFSLPLKDEHKHILVQPVTLRVRNVNGRSPTSQEERDIYSWHINMDTPLPDHLWGFLNSGGAEIDIIFHKPLDPKDFQDRKVFAQTATEIVRAGLAIK